MPTKNELVLLKIKLKKIRIFTKRNKKKTVTTFRNKK